MIHENDVLVCICDRREVSVISHRPVTRSDLKQKRLFFVGVSQHFCNWL